MRVARDSGSCLKRFMGRGIASSAVTTRMVLHLESWKKADIWIERLCSGYRENSGAGGARSLPHN
jgi:hypothetical protein